MLKGIAASEGIGIGKIFAVTQQKITYEQKPVIGVHKEIDRLHDAIDTFVEKTEALAEKMEQIPIVNHVLQTDTGKNIKEKMKSGFRKFF